MQGPEFKSQYHTVIKKKKKQHRMEKMYPLMQVVPEMLLY
jgi:hypothetical protein